MYTLEELSKICSKCEKCKLSKERNKVVFGEGNEHAPLMFVGEGPGYNEDRLGKPFVGKAGNLFDKIIKAIDLTRDDIYITNIVKCRPPNNRNPQEDEKEACLVYLRWQVKLIKPKIIVALGSVAGKTIIDENLKITKDRGKTFEKKGIKFIPTFHPAYLLRNPNAKKDSWEDFKLISKILKELKE